MTGYVSTSGIRPSPTNAPYLPESPSRRFAWSQLVPPPAQGLRPTRRPPAMSLHPLRAINQLLLHLQTAALMSTYKSAIATASIAASYARHAPPLAGRRRRASAPSEASFDFSPPPNCRTGEHPPVHHGRSQLPQCRGEMQGRGRFNNKASSWRHPMSTSPSPFLIYSAAVLVAWFCLYPT